MFFDFRELNIYKMVVSFQVVMLECEPKEVVFIMKKIKVLLQGMVVMHFTNG